MKCASRTRLDSLHIGSVVFLLLGLLLFGGCEGPQEGVAPQDTASPGATAAQALPEINLQADSLPMTQKEVTLYYRMQGEDLLAGETRMVYLTQDKRLEERLIEALIEGPSPSQMELRSLLSSDTQIRVWSSGTLLTVQLSRAFLYPPTDAPTFWENDPAWKVEVLLRRRLALASIVNTITEATDFTSVQFFLQDSADNPTGRRLLRSELYEGAGEDEMLTPMVHSEHMILTHYNTANIIMQSWTEKDFTRMYRFVARETGTRPTDATFLSEMMERGRSLINFLVSSGAVSEDGQRAIVEITYQYLDGGEDTVIVQNHPLVLVRENGLWKISYAELIRLMEAT